jgi:methionine synthase I (cobalamin-dependent)
MSWWTEMIASAPVITDGAWGTQMQARGLGVGDFPDAWNLSHPDRVRAVAQAYVEAGSAVILTNTFGATQPRLAEVGLASKVADINREGARISGEAANGRARVFGSLGPTGKMLMTGDISLDELRAAFGEQAEALAEGGADALVVETMSDPEEAKAAVEAAKATHLPVVACMVFDAGKDNDRTMMGTTPEQAAALLTEAGADVVGSNCGQGVEGFVGLCRRLKAATDRPIWIKANAGIPEMVDGKVLYRTTAEEFAGHWGALKEAGASFVGGCCGTDPEFIRALVRARQAG